MMDILYYVIWFTLGMVAGELVAYWRNHKEG